jgi:hypothetical protein
MFGTMLFARSEVEISRCAEFVGVKAGRQEVKDPSTK